MERHC